jgi:IS5 family transposase
LARSRAAELAESYSTKVSNKVIFKEGGVSHLQTVTGQSRKCVVALKLGKGFRHRRVEINSVQRQMSVLVFIKEEAGSIRETE